MRQVRSVTTGVFTGVFGIIWCLFGVAALVVNLAVINEALGWGFWGIVLAIVVFPLTMIAAPWYALIAWGNPIPLALTYGGFVVLLVGGAVVGILQKRDRG